MKKALNTVVLPLLAGCVVIAGLHMVLPHTHMQFEAQCTTNTIIGMLGFFFGFLPCFIYGAAVNTLAALRPASVACNDQSNELPAVYIGQVLNSGNCGFRVKAVNVRAILEYNNELLADYL